MAHVRVGDGLGYLDNDLALNVSGPGFRRTYYVRCPRGRRLFARRLVPRRVGQARRRFARTARRTNETAADLAGNLGATALATKLCSSFVIRTPNTTGTYSLRRRRRVEELERHVTLLTSLNLAPIRLRTLDCPPATQPWSFPRSLAAGRPVARSTTRPPCRDPKFLPSDGTSPTVAGRRCEPANSAIVETDGGWSGLGSALTSRSRRVSRPFSSTTFAPLAQDSSAIWTTAAGSTNYARRPHTLHLALRPRTWERRAGDSLRIDGVRRECNVLLHARRRPRTRRHRQPDAGRRSYIRRVYEAVAGRGRGTGGWTSNWLLEDH